MRHLVVLVLLVACSRCENADAPTERPVETTEPQPTEPQLEPTPTEATRERAHRPPAPSVDDVRVAREAIAEGRRLAAADDFEGALAAFDRALAATPTAVRIRCEAGFLAHRAGDHARAEREIDIALAGMPLDAVPEPWKVPVAMCLYNRGLVAEAREDDVYDTMIWYDDSLELRENATVRARLNALERSAGEEVTPAVGSLEALMRDIGDVCDEQCDGYLPGVQQPGEGESCWEIRVHRDDERGDARATILYVYSTECLYDVTTTYLALQGTDGWTAYPLGSTSIANTDSFYREESDDSSETRVTRLDDTWVRVDYILRASSHYGGDEESEDGETCYIDNFNRSVRHTLMLCRQDRGLAECASAQLGFVEGGWSSSSCDDDEEDGEHAPAGLEDGGEVAARTVRFEDGFAIVEATPHAPASDDGLEPGRRSIEAFFASLSRVRRE